ncbi:unnamed protein product [Closterium sp. Naga37s-1]|nr:unnamed protein product [Closterium sp. Naga37s-1]
MAALRCPLRSRAIPACLGIHSLAQSSLPLSNWRAPSSPCLSATRSLRGACGAIFPSPRTPRVPQFPAPASGGSRISRASPVSGASRISRASPVSGASPVSRRSPPSAAAGGSIRRGSGSAPAAPPASLLNLAEVSEQLPADLSGYLARVRECNAGLERRWEFIPFVVNGEVVGYIHHSFWQHLEPFGDVFSLHHHAPSSTTATTTNSSGTNAAAAAAAAGRVLSFSGRLEAAGAAERTEAVGGVLQRLREQGVVTGWRNELYPVGASFYAPPAFLIERAAAPLFGTKAYGVHMNGYTHLPSSSSSLHLWVARRSPLKPTFPNQLDHLVAGGQPHGISCRDNMIKECEEEADIPRHLAER